MADGKKTKYELKHPFEFEGVLIEDLDWREPRGREIRRMYNITSGAGDRLSYIAAECCEVEQDMIDGLHAEDWAALTGALAGFLPSG